jgi:hypothetical protein
LPLLFKDTTSHPAVSLLVLDKPFSLSLFYPQQMNREQEQGVLALGLEFEEEEELEEEDAETMVQPKLPSEGGGGRFKAAVLTAVIVSLLLIVGVSVTSKARFMQPALRSVVGVDNASDLEFSDNGSRTFEFVLTTLEGLEGKSGVVIIKTMPEWAPLGVKQFHVS